MSSTTQGSQTATTAIGQYLSNNSGWHEINEVATATGYSYSHTRTTLTEMAEDESAPVQRRVNVQKPVIAYRIDGDWEVPGSDPQSYIRLIRMYGNPSGNLQALSLDRLQKELRNLAEGTTVPQHKVEFRIP